MHDWALKCRAGGRICLMITLLLASSPVLFAAAGWAFLVWLGGGGFGLAFLVFIVLKLIGK